MDARDWKAALAAFEEAVELVADESVMLAVQLFEAARERLGWSVGSPLPNPMHERYAQLRAAGHTILQAYVMTGRRPDQSSASKWERRHPLVRVRICELQAEGIIPVRIPGRVSSSEPGESLPDGAPMRPVAPAAESVNAAFKAAADPRVNKVIICTPDKDLAQVVSGTRIVQMNRRTREIRDEAGVVAKFGVPPASIPDYLALVGDAAPQLGAAMTLYLIEERGEAFTHRPAAQFLGERQRGLERGARETLGVHAAARRAGERQAARGPGLVRVVMHGQDHLAGAELDPGPTGGTADPEVSQGGVLSGRDELDEPAPPLDAIGGRVVASNRSRREVPGSGIRSQDADVACSGCRPQAGS